MDANEKLNRIGQQLKAKDDDFSTYQKENDRKPRITQIDEDDQEMESQGEGGPLESCLDGLTIVVSGVFQSVTRD